MAKISVEQFCTDPYAAMSQPRELERVSRKIELIVLQFCRERDGSIFNMPELEAYVAARRPVTPGSAGRILRQLREKGYVEYNVVNRRKAAYRLYSVAEF